MEEVWREVLVLPLSVSWEFGACVLKCIWATPRFLAALFWFCLGVSVAVLEGIHGWCTILFYAYINLVFRIIGDIDLSWVLDPKTWECTRRCTMSKRGP